MQLHSAPHLKKTTLGQCPHGMMPGACPACSGGGGGSGGGKTKTAGLMSWNEAYAVWNALQVNENRQKDYLKNSSVNAFLRQQEARQQPQAPLSPLPFLNELTRTIASWLGALGFGKAPNTPDPMTGRTQNALIPQPGETVAAQLAAMARSASQKLAAVLADAVNIIETAFENNLEVLKSLMAQLKWENLIGNAYRLMGRLLGPARTHSVLETLNEKMKPLLNGLARLLGRKPEPLA